MCICICIFIHIYIYIYIYVIHKYINVCVPDLRPQGEELAAERAHPLREVGAAVLEEGPRRGGSGGGG